MMRCLVVVALLFLVGYSIVEYRYRPVVLNVEVPPTLAREEDVLAMTDQQAEGYLRSLLLKNRQYALYCNSKQQRTCKMQTKGVPN